MIQMHFCEPYSSGKTRATINALSFIAGTELPAVRQASIANWRITCPCSEGYSYELLRLEIKKRP